VGRPSRPGPDGPARTVLTPDGWKLTYRRSGAHELYHLDDDPYETTNPLTGEKMQVGPRKSVHFKVGKELEERVDTLNEYDD